VPLLQWELDHPGTISSISDRDAASLRELQGMGLVPGTTLSVKKKTPNASLMIRISGARQEFRLSNELAALIALKTT
jgi:Fe2+ transport system protein FeoA